MEASAVKHRESTTVRSRLARFGLGYAAAGSFSMLGVAQKADSVRRTLGHARRHPRPSCQFGNEFAAGDVHGVGANGVTYAPFKMTMIQGFTPSWGAVSIMTFVRAELIQENGVWLRQADRVD